MKNFSSLPRSIHNSRVNSWFKLTATDCTHLFKLLIILIYYTDSIGILHEFFRHILSYSGLIIRLRIIYSCISTFDWQDVSYIIHTKSSNYEKKNSFLTKMTTHTTFILDYSMCFLETTWRFSPSFLDFSTQASASSKFIYF